MTPSCQPFGGKCASVLLLAVAVITAPRDAHAKAIGIGHPGQVPDSFGLGHIYHSVIFPVFADASGNFLPGDSGIGTSGIPYPTAGVPLEFLSFARNYGLQYGETRPFLYGINAWVEDSADDIHLSVEFEDPSDAERVDVRLAHVWTYHNFKTTNSDLVREFPVDVSLPGGPGHDYALTMSDIGPNDENWRVQTAIFVTPKTPDGFTDPFRLNFFHTSYGEGGGQIQIQSRASVWSDFTILPEPSSGAALLLLSAVTAGVRARQSPTSNTP